MDEISFCGEKEMKNGDFCCCCQCCCQRKRSAQGEKETEKLTPEQEKQLDEMRAWMRSPEGQAVIAAAAERVRAETAELKRSRSRKVPTWWRRPMMK